MIRMTIELQPFTTPNFVIGKMPPRPGQDGLQDPPKWALSEVDATTLSVMCHAFRAEVFKKAGKKDPMPPV